MSRESKLDGFLAGLHDQLHMLGYGEHANAPPPAQPPPEPPVSTDDSGASRLQRVEDLLQNVAAENHPMAWPKAWLLRHFWPRVSAVMRDRPDPGPHVSACSTCGGWGGTCADCGGLGFHRLEQP